MTGKLDPETISRLVYGRTGAPEPDLIQGAAFGEDTAAVPIGDETLVINADPCSLAAEHVGTIAVHVACNDVAASGAHPRWLTSTILLPEADAVETLDRVTAQLDAAAREVGTTIVGGHTERSAQLERPLLAMTAMGLTDRYVATGSAEPGDRLLLTKGAGVEATGIMATDFRAELEGDVDEATIDRAADFFEWLSVVPDAEAIGPFATAMHDPTEGGVLAGLVELALAGEVRCVVSRDDILVREETAALANTLGIDPLRTFGSGALLATVPEETVGDALGAADEAGIEAAEIGRIEGVEGREAAGVEIDGALLTEVPRDDMYALWS
ncbi:hydrogenase expression/formation protein HypE [Halalkaliarchaeum desulfuricum]|uniref:Hydrogenase expression/formation protein HypE n=1 Tax=Halalkaliarchaeum desulfuricum TaxID=2055893 RepID=A0A343TH72_9EURY|nr:AIR synthase family protein [Halalkaliarchaeum desulfuricum]AUX08444.1 hydrogenase expression/formation protein HypE [Halalkaliarchaeum desulfuricum]